MWAILFGDHFDAWLQEQEFDPVRQAIILCAGDKSNDKKFYERMIRIADDAFSAHLNKLEGKI